MKMASQRFCLRWNNHQSNLLSVFDQLLHAETFTDVTLAVDGQYLKAHKMVLSACSPYFNTLFVNHPEKHPIVILKDVPYSDMKSLLDFMYRGEVSVDQERLTAFLRVAESLRIKGLTEVNDDKPAANEPTPPPPQLQRIQPYLVQQQQQQQRNKSQASLLASNNLTQVQQPQQSLLSSALVSMPKRKRGRPRKLSGSSNGTGNDFDDYDRDGMMNDSEMGDGKHGNDSFSGNDDGSDDNQRDCGNNELDDNQESPSKKLNSSKDINMQQNDNDNSTSVPLVNTSPELSQRLFGISKSTLQTKGAAVLAKHTQSKQQDDTIDGKDTATHLPTALGLRICNPQQQQRKLHKQQLRQNTNSLLKQQLRAGPKDFESNGCKAANNSSKLVESTTTNNESHYSALQSLANAAEKQSANPIQPPSANNLHHQFLLHMAANPMLKTTDNDFFQKVQPQQQSEMKSPTQQADDDLNASNLELMLEQNYKSEPELTLVDESLSICVNDVTTSVTSNTTKSNKHSSSTSNTSYTGSTPRPVQRRRIRRKAQSTIDDQAEHLTEMSVRGLDLFRYASITEGVYQCTECAKENLQKTFKNKYSFQRHAFLYHEGKHRKVFPCPLCGKEFSRPDKMKNHMKMTHENYAAKDINNFSPINYLITAAAAGEIHSSLYSQQQQQQQHAALVASDGMQQEDFNAAINNMELNADELPQSPPSPTPAEALLTLQNDNHIIKTEIVISPSPSPPPQSAQSTTTAQPPAARLEEVK